MRNRSKVMLAAMAVLLAACGGGESPAPQAIRGSLTADAPAPVPVPQSGEGSSAALAPEVLNGILESFKPGLTQLTGTPKCAVSVYTIKYATIGGAGEETDATASVMVPAGGAGCSGPRPVLLYGHGTSVKRDFDMARLRTNGEALLVAGTYAAQGFVVVAPNYAGYAGSRLSYHPYLNAGQQAEDMVDAMRAARGVFAGIGVQDSGQLFLGGYSQGGYVALATLRAIQQKYGKEFAVTAVGGMSGPYALGLLTDASFGGSPALGGTVFLPMMTRSYQNSYGGMYNSASDIYEEPYVAGLDAVLPGPFDTVDMFTQGKLPQSALFARNSLPGPASPALGAFFGDGNLIKSSYRNLYLSDIGAHSCGADPAICRPALPLRAAVWSNDLRNFVPAAPTMLCGGKSDPTVFFVSTETTAQYFRQKGMQPPLTVLDVDTAPNVDDPFTVLKQGFALTKAGVRSRAQAAGRDPDAEVAVSYHSALVPSFCMAGTRAYFQNFLPRS